MLMGSVSQGFKSTQWGRLLSAPVTMTCTARGNPRDWGRRNHFHNDFFTLMFSTGPMMLNDRLSWPVRLNENACSLWHCIIGQPEFFHGGSSPRANVPSEQSGSCSLRSSTSSSQMLCIGRTSHEFTEIQEKESKTSTLNGKYIKNFMSMF